MYKRASRNLQHAHGVDRPHPSRGYIDGPSNEADVLPPPDSLSVEALRDEQKQLRAEVARAEQDIAIAKATGKAEALKTIGQRKVVLCTRLSAVNKAMTAKDGPNELSRFIRAAREIVGNDVVETIFQRSRELRTAAASIRALAGGEE